MSLRLRIILTFALLMAASFSVIIWLIISDVRPRYLEAVEEATVDTAELIAALLSEQISGDELPVVSIRATMENIRERSFEARIYSIIKRKMSLRIYITDAEGMLLYDSSGLSLPGEDFSRWRDVYLTLRGHYGARSTRTVADDPSSQVIFVAAPILKGQRLVGVVSVGKPTNSISFLIAIAQKRFMLSLILVALAAITLSVGLSFWITRPVNRLTAYVKNIREGKAPRLPALASPEIGELGRAMEEMQAKLEGKHYIEDYVRSLTHELKSPLTGIRGAGEILRDHVKGEKGRKFLDNIESDTQRLQSLVERMLQLSRLENVRTITKSSFRLSTLFDELAVSLQTQLNAKDLRLVINSPTKLYLTGDIFLLRQALGNLLANAIDFSASGSAIVLTAFRQGDVICIRVRDHGTGMPDFALEKAFNKFFSLSRPDTGKKSTGLGLPFVAEVVALHSGTVTLRNAEPGLEVLMTLPQ